MQGCRGFRGRTGVNSLSESGERSRQTLWRRSSRPGRGLITGFHAGLQGVPGAHGRELVVGVGRAQQADVVAQVQQARLERVDLLHQPRGRAGARRERLDVALAARRARAVLGF